MEDSETARPGQGTTSRSRQEKRNEPKRTARTQIANKSAGLKGPAGERTGPSKGKRPVKRHALLIALSPDGEYPPPPFV